MTKVAAFIERVLLGAGHAQGREDVSRELAVERENLKREHDDLQSARRQARAGSAGEVVGCCYRTGHCARHRLLAWAADDGC